MGLAQALGELQLRKALVHGIGEAVSLVFVESIFEAVVIAVVTGRGCQCESFTKPAVPPQGAVQVAVAESRVAREAELVAGKVAVGVECIALVELVAQAQVRILERGLAAGVFAVGRQKLQQPV